MTAVIPEGDGLKDSFSSDIFPDIPAVEAFVASTSTHTCAVLLGASNDCGSSTAYACMPDVRQTKKQESLILERCGIPVQPYRFPLFVSLEHPIGTRASPSSFFSSESCSLQLLVWISHVVLIVSIYQFGHGNSSPQQRQECVKMTKVYMNVNSIKSC